REERDDRVGVLVGELRVEDDRAEFGPRVVAHVEDLVADPLVLDRGADGFDRPAGVDRAVGQRRDDVAGAEVDGLDVVEAQAYGLERQVDGVVGESALTGRADLLAGEVGRVGDVRPLARHEGRRVRPRLGHAGDARDDRQRRARRRGVEQAGGPGGPAARDVARAY